MDKFVTIFNKNIDNFDSNKENIPPINYELIQKNFIESSLPENNDESFVKELFEKAQKSFRSNKDGKYPKKVHNFKIKGVSVKLTLKINGIGYWLCEMTNVSLKYNTMSVFALEQNKLLNENSLFSDIQEYDYKFENNKLYLSSLNNDENENENDNKNDNDSKYTNVLFISYNLVYPISKYECNDKLYTINLKGLSFLDYINFTKSFVEVYIYISTRYRYISLDEIFYLNNNFPIDIIEKINKLKMDLQNIIDNILEISKKIENEEVDGKKLKYFELSVLKDNLQKLEYEFQDYLKIFHKNNDNWKVFAYAFMKNCPISF